MLLSFPTRYGGLNIPFCHKTAKFEYGNSRITTKQLTNFKQYPIKIINQDPVYAVNGSEFSKLKNKINAEKEEQYKNILQNHLQKVKRD